MYQVQGEVHGCSQPFGLPYVTQSEQQHVLFRMHLDVKTVYDLNEMREGCLSPIRT